VSQERKQGGILLDLHRDVHYEGATFKGLDHQYKSAVGIDKPVALPQHFAKPFQNPRKLEDIYIVRTSLDPINKVKTTYLVRDLRHLHMLCFGHIDWPILQHFGLKMLDRGPYPALPAPQIPKTALHCLFALSVPFEPSFVDNLP